MLLLVAFSAIIIPLVLLVLLRMPARYAMPIAALSVALLGATVWGMEGLVLTASGLQGLHRAMTIIWILCGAIFLLFVVEKTGALDRIKQGFFTVSRDMRVQTVLVAFAFVAIIEAVSGFGTPAAMAVPLLVALGFHPMTAVILALVGDSVPTSFGALATPLLIGLANIADPSGTLVGDVATKIALIDSLYGLLLPLMLVTILVVAFGRKRERVRDITEIAPWSLLVGASYVAATIASVLWLRLEFAAIVGGVVALLVGVLTAHRGILQPAAVWRHHITDEIRGVAHEKPKMSLVKAWFPYGFAIALLLLQRLVPMFRDLSQSVADASWHIILGIEGISSQWQVLYSPGTVLLVSALVTALLFQDRLKTITAAGSQMFGKVMPTALALGSTLIMVQVFANSGINTAELASMPVYIAETLARTFGPVWLAVAPFLGTIAAFIMGSSTVSTLTMSPVQYSVAVDLGIPVDVALAQQVSGANAGNSIAVHNVVAASAVAGLHHQEGRIIRHALPAVFVYVVCTIIMAILVLALI